MAGQTIKGITIELGGSTTKLGKALKSVEGYSKDLESQLKNVEKALKLDPDSTELLSQKQRILGQQVENTREKLDMLKKAQEEAAKSVDNYDAWVEAYTPIQEQIEKTKKQLTKLQAEQKKMERAGEIDTEPYQDLSAKIDALKGDLKDLHDQSEKVSEQFGNPISTKEFEKLQIDVATTEAALNAAQNALKAFGNSPSLRTIQNELKEVNKLLEFDSSNTTLLEQKQELLTDAIRRTHKSIESMEEDYNRMLGECVSGVPKNAEAFRKLERQIEAAKMELKDLTTEAENTEKKLNGIDDDAIVTVADSLETATEKCNALEKELSKANEALELDPSNITVLTQKQDILKDSIEATTEKLKLLEDQQKDISNQYASGDIDRGAYVELQAEIAKTKKKLNDLEESAKDNFDDIADATDTARIKLRELGEAAETVKTKADGIASAFQPVTAAVAGLAGAAVATVPATEELREDLSKLDANARENAVSVDAAREAWKKFAVQSGETDSAVEATSNLLQAGFTESNLQKAVEGLAGAALRFPDTLNVESLADSLQETLASGEATGQFSELLSRLGMDTAAFSEIMAACTTEAEKQNLILQTLADAGLNSSYEAWKANNEEMLANKEANLELELSFAELAEVVLPIVTDMTDLLADLIGWFTDLPSPVQGAIAGLLLLAASISPVASGISGISDVVKFLTDSDLPKLTSVFGNITGSVLPGVGNAFSSVFGFIAANPVVLLIGAIVGAGAAIAIWGDDLQKVLQNADDYMQDVFAKDWTETFGPVLGGIMNSFMDDLKNWWDAGMNFFNGIIDFIRGVFTLDFERAGEGIKEIFSGCLDGILALAGTNIEEVEEAFSNGIEKIKGFFSGWEWKWPKLKMPHFNVTGGFDFTVFPPAVPKIGVEWYAKGGILNGAQIFGALGNTLLGGGEAGPEAVLPLESFYDNLRDILTQLVGSPSVGNSIQVILNIEHFENSREQDIDELADDLAERFQFKIQQKEAGL